MRRPDFRWEIESEVEFPSPAFCQVEGVPDGFLKIGFRDGNLQAQYFYRRAFLDGVIGFVQLFFLFAWLLCFGCASGENAKTSSFRPSGVYPIWRED